MTSTHSFRIADLPRDPYEAEKFVLDQIKYAFTRAHEADMTGAIDFNMTRAIGRGDPFGENMTVHLKFDGDSSKGFAHTTGEVRA